MIEGLVSSYAMEKFDKQIIGKIPYSLLLAFILNSIIPTGYVLPLVITAFSIFLVCGAIFNWSIRKRTENIWGKMNFKELIEKFASIYEGRASFVGDIGICKKSLLILTGCLSGIAFLCSMALVFIIFIQYVQLSSFLLVALGIIVTIYIIQDLVKNDFFEDKESGNSSASVSMIYDFMDKYIVENSQPLAPADKFFYRVFIGILVKASGPLVYVSVPKFSNTELLVYNDKEVKDIIGSFTVGERGLQLQHEQGISFSNFFTAKSGGRFICENITIMAKDSPREVFPYILNPKYDYEKQEGNKRWTAFKIIDSTGKPRPVGTLFIHMFRGASVSARKALRKNPEPLEEILYFYIVGERSFVNYLKTKLEMNTAKVPSDIILRTLNLD